jgi:hypothetical protein
LIAGSASAAINSLTFSMSEIVGRAASIGA